ncbi:AraC family transcriptional regulator [Ureibacillus sinduriensis]|uniref:AraC family transcriptional regulator n=1 Tax=Ureibacillus sinduriensis BLB-1 = JCM 15800 TaxID=1384057 RepID=A0A0A3HYH5_9BACL|nr:GyrI-like domain-containing protein [Ureibacillus sinduriensis]KGR76265.1 AraC family transcriptional regulator [Ureibacillus sinduriensis BLB-1 = JCM 15800]
MEVEVRELGNLEVAYIRRTGSYSEPQEHWGKLFNWALSNGLFPAQQAFIGISLDNPEVVEADRCRHDACVTIPEGFGKEKHPDIQYRTLDGGLYALHPFYDTPAKLNGAYQFMYGQWLPRSDYEADYARHSLEFNMNNPAEDPEGKCKVDLYVPIKRKVT